MSRSFALVRRLPRAAARRVRRVRQAEAASRATTPGGAPRPRPARQARRQPLRPGQHLGRHQRTRQFKAPGEQARPREDLRRDRGHQLRRRSRSRSTPSARPKTGGSFKFLADEGFYDGTADPPDRARASCFQGGDPQGTGKGGPGYSVVEKPPSDLVYDKGVVAMAKTADAKPGSSGSQFFVVTGDDGGRARARVRAARPDHGRRAGGARRSARSSPTRAPTCPDRPGRDQDDPGRPRPASPGSRSRRRRSGTFSSASWKRSGCASPDSGTAGSPRACAPTSIRTSRRRSRCEHFALRRRRPATVSPSA